MVNRKTTSINDHFHMYNDGIGGGTMGKKWYVPKYTGLASNIDFGSSVWWRNVAGNGYLALQSGTMTLSQLHVSVIDSDVNNYIDRIRIWAMLDGVLVATPLDLNFDVEYGVVPVEVLHVVEYGLVDYFVIRIDTITNLNASLEFYVRLRS